jgi:pyruvate kinase
METFMARERPKARIIGMTPKLSTARKLALIWGVHPVLIHDVATVTEMTIFACQTAAREQLAKKGQTIVIAAGMPFGTAGTTNLLRIAQIE